MNYAICKLSGKPFMCSVSELMMFGKDDMISPTELDKRPKLRELRYKIVMGFYDTPEVKAEIVRKMVGL